MPDRLHTREQEHTGLRTLSERLTGTSDAPEKIRSQSRETLASRIVGPASDEECRVSAAASKLRGDDGRDALGRQHTAWTRASGY
jgi:hypothetical protein